MSELAIAVAGHDSVQSYVRQARELALRNPEAWAVAFHNIYGQELNRAIFAGMEGTDDAEFGRVMRQVWRDEIIRAATDRAKDELDELGELERSAA